MALELFIYELRTPSAKAVLGMISNHSILNRDFKSSL